MFRGCARFEKFDVFFLLNAKKEGTENHLYSLSVKLNLNVFVLLQKLDTIKDNQPHSHPVCTGIDSRALHEPAQNKQVYKKIYTVRVDECVDLCNSLNILSVHCVRRSVKPVGTAAVLDAGGLNQITLSFLQLQLRAEYSGTHKPNTLHADISLRKSETQKSSQKEKKNGERLQFKNTLFFIRATILSKLQIYF